MKSTALNAITVVAACLLSSAALADQPKYGPNRQVISKFHQPIGTPHKASSFAPHHTNRKVFGQPIQPPIMGHVTPPKKPR